MKISDMDEKTFNRFSMLNGQAERIYGERRHSFRTEANYKQGMSEFVKYLAAESKINKIENFKAKDIFGFVENLKENGVSASTQKTYLSAIRDFADRSGIDSRRIPDNKRLDLDKRIFGHVDRSWTEKEFQDFKVIAERYDIEKGEGPKMELILEVARNFGCRLEGILGMDLNSVKKALETGELATREKNGKENIKPVESLKQREILQRVKALGEENQQRKIFVHNNFKSTYREVQNFIGNNNKDIQDQDRINNADARIAYKETGEVHKGNLTIHGLRHTYAKEQYQKALEEGLTEKEAALKVSKIMGHNREQVTKIYLAK